MTALLDLIDLTTSLISKRSKAEECLTLNASLLKILSWLLKFFLAFIEASNRGQMSTSIVMKNAEKTFEILKDFYQDEFIFNLLYVTKVSLVMEFLLSSGSKLEKMFGQKSTYPKIFLVFCEQTEEGLLKSCKIRLFQCQESHKSV